MNSVINSAIQNESQCLDLQFFDVSKCYDSLWTEECGNDLYEAGITDDKLAMVYNGNLENEVAVNIPVIGLKTWSLSRNDATDDKIIIADSPRDAVEKAIVSANKRLNDIELEK